MHQIITKQLFFGQGKTRLVVEYNKVDQKYKAILQTDEGTTTPEWWDWMRAEGDTPGEALTWIDQMLAEEEEPVA